MFNVTPEEKRVILILLVMVLVLVGFKWYKDSKRTPIGVTGLSRYGSPSTDTTFSHKTAYRIVVQVDGAVNKPGVYELSTGSRVFQAIQLAGSTTVRADTRSINLAEYLNDGEKVFVPDLQTDAVNISPAVMNQPLIPGPGSPPANPAVLHVSRKVNINTASPQELDQLPGVGPATAQKIIAYRSRYGRFKRTEDIINIKGIGEKKFLELRDYITVN